VRFRSHSDARRLVPDVLPMIAIRPRRSTGFTAVGGVARRDTGEIRLPRPEQRSKTTTLRMIAGLLKPTAGGSS
jgi:hypothetical protein